MKNNVRACSPLFSFTTSGFVSRCDVAPSPPPFFSFFFLVGDRPCCCTRAPPNRITARGKRNFRRNKLRGNTKNRHFADVGPLVIIKAFALPPLHNPFSSFLSIHEESRSPALYRARIIIDFTMIQGRLPTRVGRPPDLIHLDPFTARHGAIYLGQPLLFFSPMPAAVSPHEKGVSKRRKARRRDVPTNVQLFLFFSLPPPPPFAFRVASRRIDPRITKKRVYNLCMELLIDSPHRFNDRFTRYKEFLSRSSPRFLAVY